MIKSSPELYIFIFLIQLSYALTTSPWSPPSSHSFHADECNALLRFGASFTINLKIETLYLCKEDYFNFTSYPTTTSWKEGSDCCSWQGITCDNVTGNLTNLEWLDLSSNSLSGKIPAALADLTYLAILNLSNNQLEGPIPYSNQFAGSFGADSFNGNAGLCGLPLPRLCGEVANKSPPHTSHEVDEEDADIGNWIEWRAVAMGSGCGTLVGISLAQTVLVIGRPLWLMKILQRVMQRLENRARRTPQSNNVVGGTRGQGRRQTTR